MENELLSPGPRGGNVSPETLELTIEALRHCRMFIVDGLGYRPKVADERAALQVQIDNVLALLKGSVTQDPEERKAP